MRPRIFLPLGVLILVLVTALSAWSIYQLGAAIQFERKSKMIESSVQTLYRYLQEAESTQRKFLLTSKTSYSKSLEALVPKIPKTLDRLSQLVEGDSDQEDAIETLQELIDLKLEELRTPEGLPDTERDRFALAVQKTEKEEGLMHEIHLALDDLDQSAKQDARKHEAFAHKYTSVLIGTITVASALAIFLVIAFGILSRRELAMRIRTEKELKSAQEAALIASKLKSQFLATVSHEIRTPLNGIIGMSDLLAQKVKDPEQKRFLKVICESGESLLRMVNDILDFAKIEAGKIQIELTEFSVLRTVEQVTELFSIRAQAKNLVLATYVDPNLPTTVVADGTRISQVLGNLIGNAVKFTIDGGVMITSRVISVEGNEARLRFEIEDTGPGIDPQLQNLLFQPFNSFNAGGRKFEGSGLGLSICKNLVEQMRGKIGVESVPGKGSTFWFELPVRVAASARVGQTHPVKPRWNTVSVLGGGEFLKRTVRSYAQELNIPFASKPEPGGLVFAFVDDTLPPQIGADLVLVTSKVQEDLSSKVSGRALGILRLPFSREELFSLLEEKSESRIAVDSQTSRPKADTGRFILLVEDNATNQILAKAILLELGYRVHAVANGMEAIEALSRVPYDLILMDVQMPVMDGIAATQRIRVDESKTGRHTPIIAMTANTTEADREGCLAAGMEDVIEKPFKSADLLAKIELWLGPTDAQPLDWRVLQDLGRQTNSAVVDRLITSFLTTLPQSLDQLEGALRADNHDGVRRFAHSLKSSAGSLGARRLAELCSRVESLAQNGPREELGAAVGTLLLCGKQVEEELKRSTVS